MLQGNIPCIVYLNTCYFYCSYSIRSLLFPGIILNSCVMQSCLRTNTICAVWLSGFEPCFATICQVAEKVTHIFWFTDFSSINWGLHQYIFSCANCED